MAARALGSAAPGWRLHDDGIEHSVTTTSGPVTFESGNIPPNSAKNAPVMMSTTGTINFRCRLHGETGSIVVVN